MPTYAAMAALYPDMETVIGVRILKKRILPLGVAWAQSPAPTDNCWYIDLGNEPVGVSECDVDGNIEDLGWTGLINDCHATAGSYFFDATNSRLYVHVTGSDNPNVGYLLMATYYERVATDEVAIEEVVASGIYYPYQGLLQSAQIPDITSEIPGLQRGGVVQAFGQIAVNNDGRYDTELYDYIYECAEVDCFMVGTARGIVSDAMVMWTGWTGRTEWTDLQIFISVEDLRKAIP